MKNKKKIFILGAVGVGVIVAAVVFSIVNKPKPQNSYDEATRIIESTGSEEVSEEGSESVSSSSQPKKIGTVATSENINTQGPVSSSVMDEYLQSTSQTDFVPKNAMWMESSYHTLTDYDPNLYGKTIESLKKYHVPNTDRNYIIYVIDGSSYTLNEYEYNNDFTYNVYSTEKKDADQIIEKGEEITDGDVESFLSQINENGRVSPNADQNQATDNDVVMWESMQDMLDNHMAVLRTEDENDDVSSFGINNKGKFMYEATVFAASNLDIHANINTYVVGKENDMNVLNVTADDGSTGKMYFTVAENDTYQFTTN